MDEPYQEKHGAFLLKCAPEPDANGQYTPKLIATRLDRSGALDIDICLPVSGSYPLATTAAEFALSFGKRWVREQMLPPTHSR